MLKVSDLVIGNSKYNIVNQISFQVGERETLGIVGESGCGKSMTALSVIGLLPKGIKAVSGSIDFQGRELTKISSREMRKLLGKRIGMIFQEPMTALNPLLTIGHQLMEPLRKHRKLSKNEAREEAIKLLKEVGIREAEAKMKAFPHQLSGGMRQRVLIAMALSCSPDLLIADEPTTALDVTIQAQIIRLIRELQSRRQMSLLLISHDLGVVSEIVERIIVLYAGEIVELGTKEEILKDPQHPYTKCLVKAVEQLEAMEERLTVVKGNVPKPGEVIQGCKFYDRCQTPCERGKKESPLLFVQESGRCIRCWKKEIVKQSKVQL